jgi:hypothetical protein
VTTTRRLTYDIVNEPRGAVYGALLGCAAVACTSGLLVVRQPDELDLDGREVLNGLQPWMTEVQHSSTWPGTTLSEGDTAHLYYFRYGRPVVDFLRMYSNGLYDWVAPRLPEDLCLFRDDRSLWLATIAHEHDAYFELARDEHDELLARVPGLAVKAHAS